MCLIGTGCSGIASGHVSPALGERELRTHLFVFIFRLALLLGHTCYREVRVLESWLGTMVRAFL